VQPAYLGAQVQMRGTGRGPGGQVTQPPGVGLAQAPLGQLVNRPAAAGATVHQTRVLEQLKQRVHRPGTGPPPAAGLSFKPPDQLVPVRRAVQQGG
jgi:hypothetical protein